MAKNETKNIITKETIEKELKFLNKADIRSSLVLIAVIAVVFLPLSLLPIYIFLSVGRKTILLGICCFLGFSVFLLPIFFNLISLLKSINEAHLLKKGDWFIIASAFVLMIGLVLSYLYLILNNPFLYFRF